MPSIGRQTVLQEYVAGFPFRKCKKQSGSVHHVVHEDDLSGDVGQTYCARWKMAATDIETELDVLNVARNLCARCTMRLDDDHVTTLAAMANVSTQHEIDASDITE